jgi:hypothetical protein
MATHGATNSTCEEATQRTPAVSRRHSPAPLTVSLLVLVVLLGCAHTPPSPLTATTQAQLGSIGVVAVPIPPAVDYRTPGPGGAGGAVIGAAKGLGLGIGGAALCFLTYGYALPACGVAVATPYFAARYAVDQATEGVAGDTIAASETAIQAVLGARTHETVVRDEVVRLAAVHTTQTLVPLPAERAPSAFEPTPYKHLAAQGIDTVIEITFQRVALQSHSVSRVGGNTIWSISAAELNPYLTLAVTARTRVLKTTDGTELYGHTRGYIGKGASFTDWGANDAQFLRESLEQLLREMAGEIVTQVFGVDLPPAREPEAPAAPTPAKEPESPAQPSARDAACPTCT